MPLGTYTKAMRTGVLPGMRLPASAGVIASRNGSAIVAPMPRRNVRLPSALRVIIMADLPSSLSYADRSLSYGCTFNSGRRRMRELLTDRYDGKEQAIDNLSYMDVEYLQPMSWWTRLFRSGNDRELDEEI